VRWSALAGLLAISVACTDASRPAAPREEQPVPVVAAEPSAPAIVEPSVVVEAPAREPVLGSLEFVRQRPSPLPERFSPDGRFGAEVFGSDCDVWALDSARYLGQWSGGEEPCNEWPELVKLDLGHVRSLDVTMVIGELELTVEGKEVRASVGGVERYRFASDGEAYVDVSASPSGARLALAQPHAIELRELDTGKLSKVLSLDKPKPPGGELWHLALAWSNEMPLALIGREPLCSSDRPECPWEWADDEQPVWELRRWASLQAKVEAELVTWEDGDFPAWIYEAYADPLGRWLWISTNWGRSHDSKWERRQIPLTKAAEQLRADFSADGVDEAEDPGLNRFGLCGDAEVRGSWLTGARTARVWALSDSHYLEGSGSDELWWASLQLWPRPVASGPHELASDSSVEAQQLEVLAVADAAGVVSWSHCWPSEELESLKNDRELDDVGEDRCRGNRPVPPGCEARGFDDALAWMLIACGPDWRLLPIGASSESRESVELASIEDGSVTATYGRSGLALAGASTGLRLLGPDGRERARFPAVFELLPATLGPELDRAVGRTATGLEVFDLASGERLASVPIHDTIAQLAFAPEGRRLASTDGHRIAIHELASTVTTRSWDAGTVLGIAWRQDGAVLFSGAERPLPERAWDPVTGKLAPTQPDPELLRRLAEADLDPSWRWAFEDDDVILRTLDELALYLEDDGWVVTGSGLHDGTGEPDGLFVRTVDDQAPRVLELTELPERLRHPGLLEHFLAGVALPQPRLDPAELAD
jgi:hypothetical protein